MAREKRGVLPPIRRSLGQHFLSDPRILDRIADALELTPADTVLEIGPGRGALTDALVRRAGRVIAIEYDRRLAELLRQRYESEARVRVVEDDVLEVNLGALADGPYKLAGNVPYYITTPILFHALARPRATTAVFLVQREVAERLAAGAGTKAYGALSANVQAVAGVEMLFRVAAGAFQPPPRVESAVVRVVPLVTPLVTESEEAPYRSLVQRAFGMRRKQMRRVLRALCGMSAAEADDVLTRVGVAADARPETLTPQQFARLLRSLPAG